MRSRALEWVARPRALRSAGRQSSAARWLSPFTGTLLMLACSVSPIQTEPAIEEGPSVPSASEPTQSIDKGRVPTGVDADDSGFPDCTAQDCGGMAPVRYAMLGPNPGELLFRRPDTTRTYYLVVDDAAPDYFTSVPLDAEGSVFSDAGTSAFSDAGASTAGVIGAAAAAIIDASPSDCLAPNLFVVVRESEFDALPLATQQAGYRIRINTGQFFEVCSGAAVACANLPRLGAVDADAGQNERLRFGDHIAFVDTGLVEPTTALVEFSAYAIGVATHELLHILGLAHPVAGLLGEAVVPQTAAGRDHLSVLHGSNSDLNHRGTLQADDLLMLSRLYGEHCDYSDDFRLIEP